MLPCPRGGAGYRRIDHRFGFVELENLLLLMLSRCPFQQELQGISLTMLSTMLNLELSNASLVSKYRYVAKGVAKASEKR